MSHFKHLNAGEVAMVTNALAELEAEARALRSTLRSGPEVNITEDGLPWNVVSVIAGNVANVNNILFGEDGPIS